MKTSFTVTGFLIIIFLSFNKQGSSCKKQKSGTTTNAKCDTLNLLLPVDSIGTCIADMIQLTASAALANPPIEVYRYNRNGKFVYYKSSQCCDIPGTLFDDNCNVICHPDGGITGHGDGRCPGIMDSLSNKTLVWRDERKK